MQIYTEFDDQKNDNPFTEREMEILDDASTEATVEFLQLAYRRYNQNQNGDNAFSIAATLSALFQYKRAIEWFKKAIELNPEDWEAKGFLVYNCSQVGDNEAVIKYAMELLDCSKASEPDFRDEVYCMLADGYFFLENIDEAIKWQERILSESKSKELIEHTRELKKEWESYK